MPFPHTTFNTVNILRKRNFSVELFDSTTSHRCDFIILVHKKEVPINFSAALYQPVRWKCRRDMHADSQVENCQKRCIFREFRLRFILETRTIIISFNQTHHKGIQNTNLHRRQVPHSVAFKAALWTEYITDNLEQTACSTDTYGIF